MSADVCFKFPCRLSSNTNHIHFNNFVIIYMILYANKEGWRMRVMVFCGLEVMKGLPSSSWEFQEILLILWCIKLEHEREMMFSFWGLIPESYCKLRIGSSFWEKIIFFQKKSRDNLNVLKRKGSTSALYGHWEGKWKLKFSRQNKIFGHNPVFYKCSWFFRVFAFFNLVFFFNFWLEFRFRV